MVLSSLALARRLPSGLKLRSLTGSEWVTSVRVRVPAMVVTADQSPEVMDLLRERGLPVLQKPVKPARLRALLSHLLAKAAE